VRRVSNLGAALDPIVEVAAALARDAGQLAGQILESLLEGATFDSVEQARTLLPDVERIGLRYFGTLKGESNPVWHARWDDRSRLPDLVAMEITLPEQAKIAWPELLIKIRTGGDQAEF